MFGLGFPIQVVASENANASQASYFSVSPLDTETKQPQSGYYDLTVVPNEQKEITIRLYNDLDEEIKVNVALTDATTNDNGITSYLGEEERDATLLIGFSDIATLKNGESILTIPKKGQIDVDITVDIPKEAFDGVILGGIYVSEVVEDTKEHIDEGASVKNNIAYSIGVVLSENDTVVTPEIQLNEVFVEQRNYWNYIISNLQNIKPRIIKELIVEAKIYEKESNQLRYEAVNSTMRMAPHSNFNFGISLENQLFQAGDYTIKIDGTADGEHFSFEKDFTITTQEISILNKNAVLSG